MTEGIYKELAGGPLRKILLSLMRKNGTYINSLEELGDKELYDVVKKVFTTKNPAKEAEVNKALDGILGREPKIRETPYIDRYINNDPNKFDELIKNTELYQTPSSFNPNFNFKVPTNLTQEIIPKKQLGGIMRFLRGLAGKVKPTLIKSTRKASEVKPWDQMMAEYKGTGDYAAGAQMNYDNANLMFHIMDHPEEYNPKTVKAVRSSMYDFLDHVDTDIPDDMKEADPEIINLVEYYTKHPEKDPNFLQKLGEKAKDFYKYRVLKGYHDLPF